MMDELGDEGEVHLPLEILTEIVPRIEDLAELKAVLVVSRLAAGRRDGVPLQDLVGPPLSSQIVGEHNPVPREERVRRVLDRAVVNGNLLRLIVAGAARFLPATDANRALLTRLREGDEGAGELLDIGRDEDVALFRPSVFTLYERHIGPLTPLVAEQLRLAEQAYPRAWIEDAVHTAVRYNKRSWRYIEQILLRWEEAGAPDGIAGRGS